MRRLLPTLSDSGLREALSLQRLSSALHGTERAGWNPNRSECCCFVAFASLSPSQRAPADVAVLSADTTLEGLTTFGPDHFWPTTTTEQNNRDRAYAHLWGGQKSTGQNLLLRRLWLPLPPTSRSCRCGRPLDVLGHHRSACAVVGRLGRRGFPLENAAARVVSGGWRKGAHQRLPSRHGPWPIPLDARRLEVVVDGLPLFGRAQFAAMLVCPLGWCCQASCCHHERCLSRSGPTAERSTLPRTCGESGESAPCCPGW